MKKIIQPKHTLIEKIALELAATWYEVGRSQGLTSKHKNARKYAAANLERFIPMAVQKCLEMLRPDANTTEAMKAEIYEALMERHNDEDLCSVLPNVDVKRSIELAEQMDKKKVITIN